MSGLQHECEAMALERDMAVHRADSLEAQVARLQVEVLRLRQCGMHVPRQ
jgi:hypothetical protein